MAESFSGQSPGGVGSGLFSKEFSRFMFELQFLLTGGGN
jgi:hypothetical protein